MKTCKDCGIAKEIDLFREKSKQCLDCRKIYQKEKHKEWYEKNKEKRTVQIKEYREENKEKFKEYQKQWIKDNKDKVNSQHRKRRLDPLVKQKDKDQWEKYYGNNKDKLNFEKRCQRFGITSNEYYDLFNKQNGKCWICQQAPNKTLHIDHCHSSGKVRGLLCSNCNTGIGMFKENPDFMKNAIKYIEKEKV